MTATAEQSTEHRTVRRSVLFISDRLWSDIPLFSQSDSKMKALNDLNIFVETARQGSFSQAAHHLTLTPAAISAAIKRLEVQLGFALFVRSTRSLRLTSEGEILLEKTTDALALIQGGLDQIAETKGELCGVLSLSMPSDISRNLMLNWLDEFTGLHPKVTLRIELSDSITDFYSKPVDIAIRYGVPEDSNFVALPLCEKNVRVVCASPDYVKLHATVQKPDDLLNHNCLCFMLSDSCNNKWRFLREGRTETILVSGNRSANDGDAVRRWTKNGKGIAYKSLLDVSQDILNGSLVPLLSDWQSEPAPVYLICADKRLLSPTIRALHEFLRHKCRQQMTGVKSLRLANESDAP